MQQVAWLRGNKDGMALLPDRETLPYDLFSPHPEITSRRLETLTRLLDPESSQMPRTLFVARCDAPGASAATHAIPPVARIFLPRGSRTGPGVPAAAAGGGRLCARANGQ